MNTEYVKEAAMVDLLEKGYSVEAAVEMIKEAAGTMSGQRSGGPRPYTSVIPTPSEPSRYTPSFEERSPNTLVMGESKTPMQASADNLVQRAKAVEAAPAARNYSATATPNAPGSYGSPQNASTVSADNLVQRAKAVEANLPSMATEAGAKASRRTARRVAAGAGATLSGALLAAAIKRKASKQTATEAVNTVAKSGMPTGLKVGLGLAGGLGAGLVGSSMFSKEAAIASLLEQGYSIEYALSQLK